MPIVNPSFLVGKLGAERTNLQGLRELTVNVIEAIAARGLGAGGQGEGALALQAPPRRPLGARAADLVRRRIDFWRLAAVAGEAGEGSVMPRPQHARPLLDAPACARRR